MLDKENPLPKLIPFITLIFCLLCVALILSCASTVSTTNLKEGPTKLIFTPSPQANLPEEYRFDHFGIVVSDVEKSIDFYSKAFIWKFEPIREYRMDNVIVRGKSISYSMKIVFASIGAVRMELIEIVSGESIHTEFLKTKGQGIHHVAFHVHDLKKEISYLQGLGLEQIVYFEQFGIPVMTYFETGNGMLLELVQENVMVKINSARQKMVR